MLRGRLNAAGDRLLGGSAVPGGDELLAEGVARLLRGTHYAVAPSGYARLTLTLRRRRLPRELPPIMLSYVAGPARRRAGDAPGRGATQRGAGQPPAIDSIVFFDIESLGFIGRPLFLIGTIHGRAGADGRWELELVQYLARDYSEEEAVLTAFRDEAAGADLCVSFNGRAFDLPFIALRSAFYRLEPYRPERHLDLLPLARRCWGDRLPNCRLKTLEHLVCGRPRTGLDIESARVPEAYHRFVRTGEPFELLDVLGHNAADLASLVELHARAIDALAGGIGPVASDGPHGA